MEKTMNSLEPASMQPLVSVITANYNYARYISEAVASLQAQTYEHWELIIIDDGSSDDSEVVIRALAAREPRIRLFCHEGKKNLGLAATVKKGIEQAQGVYVAFLEADDMFAPECLALRVEKMRQSGAAVIFNHIRLIVEAGANAEGDALLVRDTHKRYASLSGGFCLERTLLLYNPIPTFSCVMAQRDLLCVCDFFPPVGRWLDWWLWLQLSHRCTFAYLTEELTFWRVHTASYNHTISARNYILDAQVMWKGIKDMYQKETWSKPFGSFLMLSIPLWFLLVLKTIHMMISFGPKGFVKKLQSKIER